MHSVRCHFGDSHCSSVGVGISFVRVVGSCSASLTIYTFLYLYLLHLPAYEDGTDRVFRNVGILNSDVGELPRRKHTTYRTRRKFEIKNVCNFW